MRPRLYLPLASVALGAALATKMSALAAFPVLLVLAAVSMWCASAGSADRRTRLLRAAGGAAVVALVAVAVVWASYLAVDPLLRWSPQQYVPVVRGRRGLLVELLPFPEAFRDGMRIQFALENRPWEGFLFGQVYTGSLWYYLPVALLVKTPLGMLALWAAGAVVVVAVRRLRPVAPYLLLPSAVLLAASMEGARDFGTRYALFLPMFLAVAAGCVLVLRWRWAPVLTAALVLFVAVSSVRTFPYYLPYSNEAFGGPSKTRLRLHDSNVDWGQDLGPARRPAARTVPERAGLAGVQGQRGAVVLRHRRVRSARGTPRCGARTAGRVGLLGCQSEEWLAELIESSRPIDQVGHSITIYRR